MMFLGIIAYIAAIAPIRANICVIRVCNKIGTLDKNAQKKATN